MSVESNNKIVPGRGLNTQKAIKMRRDFLTEQGYDLSNITDLSLNPADIQNNIESYIGSTAIPLGLVGPLLHKTEDSEQTLYGIVGTLEGALVASINRGAKAIRQSGGFRSKLIHQLMVRSPLFLCGDSDTAMKLSDWVLEHEKKIREVAESYSNHAKLKRVEHIRDEDCLHLRFYYETGDASGQNMTTTCTWHSVLFIAEQFELDTGIKIPDYIIEANGASDKKVSRFLTDEGCGRGVRIKVECELPEEVIEKVLRTTSGQLLKYQRPGKRQAERDGMVGYNINVANAVAGFFASTGQDLASIHESSLADFELKPTQNGLKASLTMYSLVIGTVGGGTGLPAQKTVLEIMNCYGEGGMKKLATIIAGFALSLELSTNAAIVSGQFAHAHERLGRNKPTNWMTRNELDEKFMRSFIKVGSPIQRIVVSDDQIDNGILMNLTKRSTNKLIGFIPVEATLNSGESLHLFIKSKALDHEVVKGLHNLSAAIDSELADLIAQHWKSLEYENCHIKELEVSEWAGINFPDLVPVFYGSIQNPEREIFMFCSERIDPENMITMDSENRPCEWTPNLIRNSVEAICDIHQTYKNGSLSSLKEFSITESIPLYEKFIQVIKKDYPDQGFERLEILLADLETPAPDFGKTLVHNDFNPRNVGIRLDKRPCIYDWELATINYPHRDIVEFLCFVLPEDFSKDEFMNFVDLHFDILRSNRYQIEKSDHYALSSRMLKEFLVSRMTFYKAASILLKLKFVDRVMNNALRMIEILESEVTFLF